MNRQTLAALTGGLLLVLGGHAAQAQTLYRSVGPDGKVTFSDTPPPSAAANAKAKGSAAPAGPVSPGSALPYELQQIASRYPVTLYTGDNCGPCASGRNLLRARGVPFTERTVNTADDIAALQRLSGDAGLPFLTIGGQQIPGFSDAEWSQYLDAAGYPKTSQLPSSYRPAPATPLVAVQRPAAASGAAAPESGASGEPKVETFNTRPRPAPAPAPDSNPAKIQF